MGAKKTARADFLVDPRLRCFGYYAVAFVAYFFFFLATFFFATFFFAAFFTFFFAFFAMSVAPWSVA